MTTNPTGRVGRVCAIDRARILKVATERDSASTPTSRKLMKLMTMILPSVLKTEPAMGLKWSG
jgi:hypothetical protein